jgi:SAM-dependent methyltransferase
MGIDLPGFFEGTGMPDPGWWEALWPNPADVLAKVGLKAGMEVIDLCSGDGWFTLQIAKIARQVTAIDIDSKLLQTTRSRLAEAKQFNCTYVEGDAYDVANLVDRQVDFVFLANAFHGVPDKPRLATAVASVLKPGGLFVIVNWHVRPREETTVLGEPRGPATALRIGPEAVELAVRQAPLKSIRIVEIPPYHYASIFQKRPPQR